jgi:hypothetical protein
MPAVQTATPLRLESISLGGQLLPLSAFILLAASRPGHSKRLLPAEVSARLGVAAGIYGLTIPFYSGSAVGSTGRVWPTASQAHCICSGLD